MTQFYPMLCLLLAWLPTAVLAQTIGSFSPASGSVGTLVTLSGTDLNAVTGVAVNGTNCVLLDQTSTSLRLLVMPGATTGPLTTTGGAPAGSAAPFTVTGTALNTAQQGPKLVGSGTTGPTIDQGLSVALSADGTTLAVGGEGDSNGLGAVWVFVRSGTRWTQQGPKLVGTGAVVTTAVRQGRDVALSADGNTLAVGGYQDDSDIGATWVFVRSGTNWTQQGPKLVGTGAVVGPFAPFVCQGTSTALSADGNTLAVGGYADDSYKGATWMFVRSGTTWTQQGPKLVGTGAAGMAFQSASTALSADGNTLAVGRQGDSSFHGATWVFVRSGTTWTQQGLKLVGTGAAGRAAQGTSVALSADGTTLAVGGTDDGNHAGATWVFSTASGPLAQRASAAPRVGTGFFPNPVTELLTVSGGARAGTLRLFDSTGRVLLTGTYHEGQSLDLSALPAGPYWLRLDQGAPQPLLKR